MVECPNCGNKLDKPEKTWTYSRAKFIVSAYSCDACGTRFRSYTKEGKHAFTLKLKKGKGFVKA